MRNQIAGIVPELTARRLAAIASLAALLSAAPFQAALAQTAPSLGTAQSFSVLGGTAVTCTTSVITGDVGVFPGTAFTNTGCTIAGAMPPATNAAAAQAHADFLSAYTALAPQAGECDTAHILLSTIPASVTLFPGTYCTGAALTATNVTLTLDGNGDANAVWIFKIGTGGTGALTGTGFSVVMAGGGQPCNVFWWVAEAVTMTDSVLQGTILAGAPTGSITLTRGTLAGRALADAAVTVTGASAIGCGALSTSPASCKGKDRDGDDDDKDHKDHKKCNQGVGNGPEDCDPGHSDRHRGSNDEHGGTPGNPGRKGG
jgi:hypothetical protein